MRLFVVDDAVAIRQTLQDLTEASPPLRWAGAAASGEEALDMVPAAQPDVVLVDYHLPGIDGEVVTADLCAALPQLEVIGLTGSQCPAVQAAFLRAGATAVYDKAEALALMRDLVSRASAAA